MSKKILFIEDEPDQITIIKMRLEANGYEVVCAMDGESGLGKAKKEKVKLKDLVKKIEKVGDDLTKNLIKKADDEFKNNIVNVKNFSELKKINGKFARVNFCSIDKDGEKCAEKIEKETELTVRGTRIDVNEKPKGKCIVCNGKANEVVYIAKSY